MPGVVVPSGPIGGQTAWDQVAKALSVAESVYGIKGAMQKGQALDLEMKKNQLDLDQKQAMGATDSPEAMGAKAETSMMMHMLQKSGLMDKPMEGPRMEGQSDTSAIGPNDYTGAMRDSLAQGSGTNAERLGGGLKSLVQEDLAAKKAAAMMASRGSGFEFRDTQLDKRNDHQDFQKMLTSLRGDKPLQQSLGRFQGLGNASDTLFSNDITPESIHEYQQAVRKSLGIGSGGVGERESTYINSLGLKGDKFLELLTGVPANIKKDDPIVQHFAMIAKSAQADIQQVMEKRMTAITSGNEDMLDRNPQYQRGLAKAISAYGDQLKLTPSDDLPGGKNAGGGGSPLPGSDAAAGDMVDMIAPNGNHVRVPQANVQKAISRGAEVK